MEPDWLDRLTAWAKQLAAGLGDGRQFLAPAAEGRDGESAASLLCLSRLPVGLYEHQRRAVERALFVLGGRALLADETGLGKTVEAIAILRELQWRGLVRRALIVVPAALVWQWRHQLRCHGGIEVAVGWGGGDGGDGLAGEGVVLLSLEQARMPEASRRLQAVAWDLVIVDEAHRLKNRRSAGYRLVAGLQKTYLLLLTATPVHNHLWELYQLVHLLRPGQLGTPQGFRREFLLGPRTCRDAERLRRLVGEVMVRTRRHEAGLELPPRRVRAVRTPFAPAERELYEQVEDWLRRAARQVGGPARLVLATVLREAASSPRACARTLARLSRRCPWPLDETVHRELTAVAQRARAVSRTSAGPKVRWLVRWARRCRPHRPGQLVAFTQFASTARVAVRCLRRAGVECAVVWGGMPPERRWQALEQFRQRAPVLVSTDVGSEGYNLQFCCRLVNLDLPWNPMRIEQRIGRVHRLGQRRPVRVVHLVVPETIEEYVLQLIYEKLGMFREVVGELDEVVQGLPGGLSPHIAHAALHSQGPEEMQAALRRAGEHLRQRWERLRKACELSRRLLDAPVAEPTSAAGRWAAP